MSQRVVCHQIYTNLEIKLKQVLHHVCAVGANARLHVGYNKK